MLLLLTQFKINCVFIWNVHYLYEKIQNGFDIIWEILENFRTSMDFKHCVVALCWDTRWTHWTFPPIIYNSKITDMIKMTCLFEEERDKNNSNNIFVPKICRWILLTIVRYGKNKFQSSRDVMCYINIHYIWSSMIFKRKKWK